MNLANYNEKRGKGLSTISIKSFINKDMNKTRRVKLRRLIGVAAFVCVCAAVCAAGVLGVRAQTAGAEAWGHPPYIVLVIDDFGQDRRGVDEMLALEADITVAVMPFMEYTYADAVAAHKAGKEVIVHMPFQANASDPKSWYGPRPILLTYNEDKTNQLTLDAIADVPHAVGLNVHVGGKSTEKNDIVTGVVKALKSKNMYFLDSYTSMKSVCVDVAKECGVPCLRRDVFLEHGGKNTAHITSQLKKAVDIAKKTGACIVIGHVGPEGGVITVNAIRGALDYIKESGVQIVPASKLLGE